MTVFINPGSGNVPDATRENAEQAMRLFVEDCPGGITWDGKLSDEPDDGRWTATITHALPHQHTHEIDMPGCDPEVTRSSTPWVSPRLYVDGSSWLWQYALLSDNDCTDDEGENPTS